MTAASDEQLVVAAQRGDRAALDALLRLHYDRIHAVCLRLTGNAADAADATQEALFAVVRGLARFDGRARVSTWIYRVATNAALDELRRRRRRPRPDADVLERTAPARDPADDVVADRLAIDAALQHLSEDFRVPVVLRDLLDLDYAEIAAVLDVPVGTVKSRIARGRAQLATLLAPRGNPDPGARRPSERP